MKNGSYFLLFTFLLLVDNLPRTAENTPMTTFPLGRVAQIWYYPVKSMRGVSLQEAPLLWTGLAGDRRHAFVFANDQSGFPWLTGREFPDMVRYVPHHDPQTGALHITTPTGQSYPIQDPALLAELTAAAGEPIHLLNLRRGAYDSLPISLASTATAPALGRGLDVPLDARRFRLNIFIEGWPAFAEEEWLGRAIHVGRGEEAAELYLSRRIKRCSMINIEPDTAERNPHILRHIVQTRDECVGTHAQVLQMGTLRVGDEVVVQ